MKKLKYLSTINASNVDKKIEDGESSVLLCNYTHVYYNEFITKNIEFDIGSCNEREREKFELKRGDLIITKDSETPDDIGVPSVVLEDLPGVVCGYHLYLIRVDETQVLSRFVHRFLQSSMVQSQFEVESKGVTRYGLSKPYVENLVIPIPPIPEQERIVEFLDEENRKIETDIRVKQESIKRLEEFRHSLVSSVVVGGVNTILGE
jgi:type I restriction enzyme S subunit